MNRSIQSLSKLIGIFAICIFSLMGCLEEGNLEGNLKNLRLVIVPSVQEVKAGDTVHFDILLAGEIVEADLYINDEKISNTSYTFTPQAPPYRVYAKKAGYLNSDTLEINVGEAKEPQLLLSASETEISIGETITFRAYYEQKGDSILAEIVNFYIDGIKVLGNKFTFKNKGNYEVIAKQAGYQDSDPLNISVTAAPYSKNIFVVGFEEIGSSSKAILWENNASGSTTLGAGVATDVFNYNGTLYISGYVENHINQTYAAKYWKDAKEAVLNSEGARANSVFVEPKNGQVFIAGNVGKEAVYWQNGTLKTLYKFGEINSTVTDIKFQNGRIYATGNIIENGQSEATIWAFGDLWGLDYDGTSIANAIAVKDGDYFIAGRNSSFNAVYWGPNGEMQLSPQSLLSEAKDIALEGNNVYVVGNYIASNESENGVIWINGNMNILNSTDKEGGANAVILSSDGTIYVAGWIAPHSYDDRTAVYWQVDASGKVIKTVELTDGSKNAEATGITLEE